MRSVWHNKRIEADLRRHHGAGTIIPAAHVILAGALQADRRVAAHGLGDVHGLGDMVAGDRAAQPHHSLRQALQWPTACVHADVASRRSVGAAAQLAV